MSLETLSTDLAPTSAKVKKAESILQLGLCQRIGQIGRISLAPIGSSPSQGLIPPTAELPIHSLLRFNRKPQ